MRFKVTHEVRKLGAQGVFWNMTDEVDAHEASFAPEMFRTKHRATYEFRFPVSVEKILDETIRETEET